MSFADNVLTFYRELKITTRLPKGVEVLNPYRDATVFSLCEQFYQKFYGDDNARVAILGINPGRFGAGLTGVPFTDPPKLEARCGIANTLPKKPELSADFIHNMIDAYGGLGKFYRHFFINSVSPLGFTQAGRNLNYYDSPALLRTLEPFIAKALRQILDIGVTREVAFCLGEGANFKYLSRLNEREKFFAEIVPLAHPRFIMQYRRKTMERYVATYVSKLSGVL